MPGTFSDAEKIQKKGNEKHGNKDDYPAHAKKISQSVEKTKDGRRDREKERKRESE